MKYCFGLLICIALFSSTASAQFEAIPNGSFEAWGSDGNPEGWSTTNSAPLLVPITKSTDHTDGLFSVHGEAKEFAPGFAFPPLLVSGNIDHPGFPFHSRPGELHGMIATSLQPGDAVVMTVNLNKAQQGVGGNAITYTTNSASLIPFSIPIYYVTADIPDTAMIYLTIGNTAGGSPTVGSWYTIDALAFGVGSSSVADHKSSQELEVVVIDGGYQISFSNEQTGYASLDIVDINGRVVRELFSGVTSGSQLNCDTHGLANGMYLCRMITEEGMITRKLVVVH